MLKNNRLSILVALVILYLSLSNPRTFDKISVAEIPHLDKIVHFMMYFGLMSVIWFENRIKLKYIQHILLASLIPVTYGILMEILQTTLTSTRTGNIWDALFNTLGILTSVLIIPKLFSLLRG
jgi:VanZ family protein